MEIETYRNKNPDSTSDYEPVSIINSAFSGIDLVLEYIDELKPDIREDYIQVLRQNLQEETNNYQFDYKVFDIESLTEKLVVLNDYPNIHELIVKLVCKHMDVPKDYHPEQGKFPLNDNDHSRAFLLWRYYRTKSVIDVLGREEGINFWKKIVVKIADLTDRESGERKPIKEIGDGWERFAKNNIPDKSIDYTIVRFDENRVLVKFDWCPIHESLEYLNDPEMSYLCYCYMGDINDKQTTKVRRRRRSQTLHLGEFCDEFFWDNDEVPNAKQPPLDFMRKLGKEQPEKIIEDYQGKV
ncbi:MAG: hypothetical protein FK732_05350 [Asgard group archaeon]|nr:hypothetical protein [Asgard group archaeon]